MRAVVLVVCFFALTALVYADGVCTDPSGGPAQLCVDTGHLVCDQMPSWSIAMPNATKTGDGCSTATIEASDLCGTGASAVVCTDGTGLIPSALLPGLPVPYYTNTGSITLTGSGTATATGTGTGTYTVTGTFSGTTTGSGTGTVTASAAFTGTGYATATATGTVTVTVSGIATGTATVTEIYAGIGYSSPLGALATFGRTGATTIGYAGEITTTQPVRFLGTVKVAELDFGTRGSILETTSGFGYGIRIIPNNFNGTLTLRGNSSWGAPGTSPATIDRWISYPNGSLQLNGPISATNIVTAAAVSAIPQTTSSSTTLSTDWIPNLPENKITNLVSDLAGKVGCHGTCSTGMVQKWDGTGLTNSTVDETVPGQTYINPSNSMVLAVGGSSKIACSSVGCDIGPKMTVNAGTAAWTCGALSDFTTLAGCGYGTSIASSNAAIYSDGNTVTGITSPTTGRVKGGTGQLDVTAAKVSANVPLEGTNLTTAGHASADFTCNGTCSSPNWAVFSDSTHVTNAAYTPAQAGTATPLMDGTASAGAASTVSRVDHVHPSDTTRVEKNSYTVSAASLVTGATNGQITNARTMNSADVTTALGFTPARLTWSTQYGPSSGDVSSTSTTWVDVLTITVASSTNIRSALVMGGMTVSMVATSILCNVRILVDTSTVAGVAVQVGNGNLASVKQVVSVFGSTGSLSANTSHTVKLQLSSNNAYTCTAMQNKSNMLAFISPES